MCDRVSVFIKRQETIKYHVFFSDMKIDFLLRSVRCMHNTSRLIAPAWESRETPDDYRRPSGARVVTGRRWERRSSMQRSVALNGRGRRPVLAELTVIPRGCRAELSTTGRTSFKETDKSESPSHRCEPRLVPTSLGRA